MKAETLNHFDRRLRNLTVGGTITLITVTVLFVYLLPFFYMSMTSLKSFQQITRDTILPMTQRTFVYTEPTYMFEGQELPGYRVVSGSEYPIYAVPIQAPQTRALALVQPASETTPNIFIDPSTQEIVEWEGDITTLEGGQQIDMYTATPVTANAEYFVANSMRYPIYQIETDEGTEQWALIRTPENIFVDLSDPYSSAIGWTGDVSTLTPAQQITLYKSNKADPANGIVAFKKIYPLYQVTLPDGTTEEWALVKGPTHVFININDTSAGVFEWEGDLTTLQKTTRVYTHLGALNLEAGLTSLIEYPIYNTAEGEQWALVRQGTGTEESLFINSSDGDSLVNAVFDPATFAPVLEAAILFYQPKVWYYESEYTVVTRANYPVYVSPENSEQNWALVRPGSGTDESIFINITNVTQDTTADEVEYIKEPIDLTTLVPVQQASVYFHRSASAPRWAVLPDDKLLLYTAPESGRGEEWALVSAGTPGISDTYFISPSEPEKGVFEYSEQWVGSMDPIDDIDPQWDNFKTAWDGVNFPRVLFNTFAVAVLGMIGTLASCTLVAYGFARFPIPYKNLIFMVLIATIILPRQVTLVPTYAFFSEIGWTNSWLPLIVPHFFANAYNVFLLRQFFQSIPREMDEAAMIDGAGPFRVLRSIIVPQAYPALVAAGLFHFVFAWNDYFEPLIYLLGRPDLQPISVAVQRFNFIYGQQPHLIQATSLMAMALPIILFFFAQRFFMQGIVITGVDK